MKTPRPTHVRLPDPAKLNKMLGLQTNDVLQRPHLMELAKNHPLPAVRKLASSVIKIKGWDKANPLTRTMGQ